MSIYDIIRVSAIALSVRLDGDISEANTKVYGDGSTI